MPTLTSTASPLPENRPHKRAKKLRGSDLFRMSMGSLSSNRLRSFLTVVGISIGVFSVVGVMTALTAIRQSIDSGLNVFGANVLEISKYPTALFGSNWWEYRHRPNVTFREAYRFKDLMAPVPVCLYARDGGERARYQDRRTNQNISIIGTDENFLAMRGYEVAYGRNLNPDDVFFTRLVTVLGHNVAQTLFPNEDPLGKLVVLEDARFVVVGVLEEKGESFGESRDDLALITISRFMLTNWGPWRSLDVLVQAPNAEAVPQIMDLAIGNMRLARKLAPEDENDFDISSNESLLRSFAEIAIIVGTAGLMISAIALLTAGIGIMNIMLVSVTERTREIGVRKSLGARRNDIMKQFLLEAVFLSQAGCLGGIILGVAAGNLVAHFIGVPMIFPWFWAAVAVIVCSGIGIGFGLYPAWKAANLHPVEALRYE